MVQVMRGYVCSPCVAYGQWTAEEAQQSSMWRELTVAWLVIQLVAGRLINMHVCWFTDNQNIAHSLQVGSKKPGLYAIALKISSLSVC